MKILVVDIEANSADLNEVSVVHCISTVHLDPNTYEPLDTPARYVYGDPDFPPAMAIDKIVEADVVIMHNGVAYDAPVLHKLFLMPQVAEDSSERALQYMGSRGMLSVMDTMLMSGILFPHLWSMDLARDLGHLKGSHSLKAWGMRLGKHKGEYAGPWDVYSEEMGDYCDQDVLVTAALFKQLMKSWANNRALQGVLSMETTERQLTTAQEQRGFAFDMARALELQDEIEEFLDNTQPEIERSFPPIPYLQLKRRDFAKKGPVRYVKRGVIPLNPRSDQQVANRLMMLGWEPKEYTDSGLPSLKYEILEKLSIEYPEARPILDFKDASKRLSSLATGDKAYMGFAAKDGRIHGRMMTVGGTATGRTKHFSPNVAQATSVRKRWGREMRECFVATDGFVLGGSDAQALEVRGLAENVSRWDGGRMADVVANGDIHTENATTLGIDRDKAKTFIYSLIYGVGAKLMGNLLFPNEPRGVRETYGREVIRQYFENNPAVEEFIKDCKKQAETKGYVISLDGRKCYVPKDLPYVAPNYKLQGDGGIFMKMVAVFIWKALRGLGLTTQFGEPGGVAYIVAQVHDEIQTEFMPDVVPPEQMEEIHETAYELSRQHFNIKIPMPCEFKVGATWAETH